MSRLVTCVLALLLAIPAVAEADQRNSGQAVSAPRKTARKAQRKTRRARQKKKLPGPAYTKRKGVRMPRTVERRVAAFARQFYRRTGHPLVITSGYRTANEQAALMYVKARQGKWRLMKLYRKTNLALEIYSAYRKKRRKGRDAAVKAMAATIQRQVRQGKYISAHLYKGAVDIRSVGMGRSLRRLFRRLARAIPGSRLVLRERRPPHWHIELSVK